MPLVSNAPHRGLPQQKVPNMENTTTPHTTPSRHMFCTTNTQRVVEDVASRTNTPYGYSLTTGRDVAGVIGGLLKVVNSTRERIDNLQHSSVFNRLEKETIIEPDCKTLEAVASNLRTLLRVVKVRQNSTCLLLNTTLGVAPPPQ